jgi:subtilisin-like proprotein convertase family protein
MRQLFFVVILMLGAPLLAQGGYSFAGVGGGAIPDGQSATPEVSPGTPLAITFNVSGVVGTMNSIALVIDMNHTYVGDLRVALYAPGGSPSTSVFWRAGAVTSTDFGFPAQLSGVYTFSDLNGTADFWATAQAAGSGTMPSTTATYLAEIAGGNNQLMVTTFASLSPAQINGSWTLLIQDVTQGDTGSVASAGLVIGTISAGTGDSGDGEDDSACSTSERPGVTTVWPLLLLVPLILLRVFQHGARGGQRTRCPKQQV